MTEPLDPPSPPGARRPRPGDPVQLTCDTCGEPWDGDEPLYSIMSDLEKGRCRHWRCHTPVDVVLRQMRERADEIQARMPSIRDTLQNLKSRL